jgi:hypothetical protein
MSVGAERVRSSLTDSGRLRAEAAQADQFGEKQ